MSASSLDYEIELLATWLRDLYPLDEDMVATFHAGDDEPELARFDLSRDLMEVSREIADFAIAECARGPVGPLVAGYLIRAAPHEADIIVWKGGPFIFVKPKEAAGLGPMLRKQRKLINAQE